VQATAWASYAPRPWISLALRLAGSSLGSIQGSDPMIRAPVQTADPANYGGEQVSLHAGVQLAATHGALRGHRLALEFGAPLHRDLNGPQMELDRTLTVGYQYTWGGTQ